MESLSCRLVPFVRAQGAYQMAVDEVLLEAAGGGQPSLRFYAWWPATLSLGYFQPEAQRQRDQRLALLPFVRRPSGGGAIVHHFELTYALALPAAAVGPAASAWLSRVHQLIAKALATLDVVTQAYPGSAAAGKHPLCFHNPTAGDLLIGGHKVVGSAQRKRRGAVLQHGSMLLGRSPHAPELPGVSDFTGKGINSARLEAAIVREVRYQWGWKVRHATLTDLEKLRVDELTWRKYAQASWNSRR